MELIGIKFVLKQYPNGTVFTIKKHENKEMVFVTWANEKVAYSTEFVETVLKSGKWVKK